MTVIVHSCRPVLGHIPICGCIFALAEMESTKQKNALFNVLLDKDDLISRSDEFVFIKEIIL